MKLIAMKSDFGFSSVSWVMHSIIPRRADRVAASLSSSPPPYPSLRQNHMYLRLSLNI